jgi:hypothetical protein
MAESAGTTTDTGASYRNRRAVPRYTLIATAEIVEPVSDMRMCGRISEISRLGCYVDVLNSLPTGTAIKVCISRDKGTFASAGKIIYVQEGMGMGVTFQDATAEQLKILDSWLEELTP